MKSLVALLLLISSLNAFAAQDRGGGSAVVCWDENGELVSATLLDLFEAKERLALTIDLGPADLPYQDKLRYAAKRLMNIDVVMAERVMKSADDFPKKVAFLKRSLIPDIHDRGDYLRPKTCTIGQMAAHIMNPRPFEKKYLVDIDLWNKADNDTRAALVIHEYVYEQARRMGEDTSDNTRYYTALVSAKEIASFTPEKYYGLLGQLCWVDPDAQRAWYSKTGECSESIASRNPYPDFDVDEMISINKKSLPLFATNVVLDDANRIEAGITARKGTTRTPLGAIIVPERTWVYFKGDRLWKIDPLIDKVTIYGKTYDPKGIRSFVFDKDGRLTIIPLKPKQ